MSSKHSRASKARWADVPAEVKFKKMSTVAQGRWKNTTADQRKKFMKKVTRARLQAVKNKV